MSYFLLTEMEALKYTTTSDRTINSLLKLVREQDKDFYVKEHKIIKNIFGFKKSYYLYSILVKTGFKYEHRLVNFYVDGKTSLLSMVKKELIVCYLSGLIIGLNSKTK